MENREIFSAITAIPPLFVRLDGRTFHRLAEMLSLKKPFDVRFNEAMVQVCTALVADSGLNPEFAYTFSDEISLYFTRLPFNGRVEKIDSVTASFAASALTLALETTVPISFDARVIPATPGFAVEYLAGRQNEAWRNHLNGYCQQALIGEGIRPRKAADQLKGLPGKGSPRDDACTGFQPCHDTCLAAPGRPGLQEDHRKGRLQPGHTGACGGRTECGDC